jgi:hypothetical protein
VTEGNCTVDERRTVEPADRFVALHGATAPAQSLPTSPSENLTTPHSVFPNVIRKAVIEMTHAKRTVAFWVFVVFLALSTVPMLIGQTALTVLMPKCSSLDVNSRPAHPPTTATNKIAASPLNLSATGQNSL